MRKGFTLVEVMIVIAIIGILAAIAMPNIIKTNKARAAAVAVNTLHPPMYQAVNSQPAQHVEAPAAEIPVAQPSTDQGPTSPSQLNNGMSVMWSNRGVSCYNKEDGVCAHFPTGELGFRSDGVVVWRQRSDWK